MLLKSVYITNVRTGLYCIFYCDKLQTVCDYTMIIYISTQQNTLCVPLRVNKYVQVICLAIVSY